ALSAVKAQLDLPADRHPRRLEQQAAARREQIEAQVVRDLPAEHLEEFRGLLRGAQTFTRLREYSKATWVRHHRIWRRPLLALGDQLVTRGLLAERDDLFWLLDTELDAAVRGELDAATTRTAIAARKVEAERLAGLD